MRHVTVDRSTQTLIRAEDDQVDDVALGRWIAVGRADRDTRRSEFGLHQHHLDATLDDRLVLVECRRRLLELAGIHCREPLHGVGDRQQLLGCTDAAVDLLERGAHRSCLSWSVM